MRADFPDGVLRPCRHCFSQPDHAVHGMHLCAHLSITLETTENRGRAGLGSMIRFALEAPCSYAPCMSALRIGHARCATSGSVLSARIRMLAEPEAAPDRIHAGRGFVGRDCNWPGPEQALVVVHGGDTPVVSGSDRLAWSVSDVRQIVSRPEDRGMKPVPGQAIHDCADIMEEFPFNIPDSLPGSGRV